MAEGSTTTGDVTITVNNPTSEEQEENHCCKCGCDYGCDCGCEKPATNTTITVIQKHYHPGSVPTPCAPVGFHNQIWGTHARDCPSTGTPCDESDPNCVQIEVDN